MITLAQMPITELKIQMKNGFILMLLGIASVFFVMAVLEFTIKGVSKILKIKVNSKNKIFLRKNWIYFPCFIIPTVLIFLIICSFYKIHFCSSYWENIKRLIDGTFLGLSSEKLRNISWALFALLFASFFTALSITLSKSTISVKQYFSFQNFKLYYSMPISALILFFVWTILLSYNVVCSYEECVFWLVIIHQILFFVFSICDMDALSNEKIIYEKFFRKAIKEIKRKNKKHSDEKKELNQTSDQYFNYCLKCLSSIKNDENLSGYKFLERGFYIVDLPFEDEEAICKYFFKHSDVNKNIFQRNKQSDISELFDNIDKIDDKDFEFFSRCLIYSSKGKLDDLTFTEILNKYLKLYEEWTIGGYLKQSHILSIKDALFNYYYLFREKEITETDLKEIKDLYVTAIKSCEKIICYSLSQVDYKTIENLIHNFTQISQFLELNYNMDEVLSAFYDSITSLATFIIAFARVKVINSEQYGDLIIPLLNHAKKITYSKIVSMSYPEILAPTDFHTVDFTYTFYLTVALVFVYARMMNNDCKDGFEDVLTKQIFYQSKSYENFLTCRTISNELKKIKPDDYFLTEKITTKEFKFAKEELGKIIEKKLKSFTDETIENLKHISDDELNNEKNSILKSFEEYNIKETGDKKGQIFECHSNIIISASKSINVLNIADAIVKDLYNGYDAFYDKNSSKKTEFVTFYDFINLANDSKTYLFPYKYREIFYKNQSSNVKLGFNTITYFYENGSQKTIKYDYYGGNSILEMEKVSEKISIKSIIFSKNQDEWQKNNETCSLSIPYTIQFCFDYSNSSDRFIITDTVYYKKQ